MDASSGEIVQVYEENIPDPFHTPYRGTAYKVQCASCSIMAEEDVFIKAAQNSPRGQI
jgi:hypothetical protein